MPEAGWGGDYPTPCAVGYRTPPAKRAGCRRCFSKRPCPCPRSLWNRGYQKRGVVGVRLAVPFLFSSRDRTTKGGYGKPYPYYPALHIHRHFHTFVEAIGEVGGGNGEHQLLDLLDIEEFAQGFEVGGLNRCGPCRKLLGELDGRAFFLGENIPAGPSRFLQGLDLLIGNALPLRRSGMSAASIHTAVHNRGAQVSQLLDFRIERPRRPDLLVELQKGTQNVGLVAITLNM